MQGVVVQVNVSGGGLPKRPVPGSLLTPLGFTGDSVAHPKIHGGPQKAVLLITAEGVDELVARGYPLFYGALGENITTRGLDRHGLQPGMRLRVGEALIELTKLRRPCNALDVYGRSVKAEVFEKDSTPNHPAWGLAGLYASVVEPGRVRPDDIICVVDRPL